MRYYVTADIHGFYDEFLMALTHAGFFDDSTPHQLIICGDLFDRGSQAIELQNFILDLMSREEVILIQGNHEDLMLQLLNHWHTSFGHANYEGNGGEFDHNPDFSPYIAKGIIALDACTVRSKTVNCIVIDDELV
ncbi:hypothetical protein P261_02772 [Lachnospiraceae bacterium TWA4]|nr:hypothetical protein P261_02772 [Lachnospiraceae bacterium TWA4]